MKLCSRGRFYFGSGRFGKGFVERALAVAFGVESDFAKASGLELQSDRGGHFWGEGARHFVLGDFYASEIVIKSDTKLAEAEKAEGGFAALDEGETFGSDFSAVGHARGKARGCGTVPSREAGAF